MADFSLSFEVFPESLQPVLHELDESGACALIWLEYVGVVCGMGASSCVLSARLRPFASAVLKARMGALQATNASTLLSSPR
jgi:hypothetical protein